jgi:hypothetical protein
VAQSAKADIEINVKGLKQVDALLRKIDKISSKVNVLNKTGGGAGGSATKDNKLKQDSLKLSEAERASMAKTRNIESQILRAKGRGIKTDRAMAALQKAKLADIRGEVTLARTHQQIAVKELGIEQKITKQNLAQLKAEQQKAKTAQASNRRRGARIGQSALIGGGFPLLFGGGPLQALAGGLGGGIGEAMSPGGGFAGSIAASAAAASIQQFADSAREVGDALKDPTRALDALSDAGVKVDNAVKQQVATLIDAGKEFEALEVINNQLNESIGTLAAERLKDLDTSFDELDDAAGKLFLKLKSDLAPAFMAIIDLAKKFVDSVGQQRIRKKARDLDQGAFKEAEKIATEAARKANPNQLFGGIFFDATKGPAADKYYEVLNEESRKILQRELPNFLSSSGSGSTTTGSSPTGGVAGNAIAFNTDEMIKEALKGHTEMVEKLKEENELEQRILELRRDGLNPSIAKTIAQLEKESKIAKDNLQVEIDKLLQKQREEGILDENDQKRLTALEAQRNAMDGVTKSTANSVSEQMKLTQAATETLDKFKEIETAILGDIKNGIAGLIKGTSTLSDLLSNVADKFLDVALNQALFGNAGGSTVTGGLFSLFGFANGGRPPVGKPSIVGEKGPELFVPRSSGTIVPNNKLGGGGSTSVVVNVDASGTDVQGDEAQARELGTLISIAVKGELVKQQRPGGLLTK